ncbi:hypothetical protein ESCNG_110010 [Neisseria gonorrhoeae]|nr:hypothetical protein ESCNG_110010 [Neisseria gonorrhoeae]
MLYYFLSLLHYAELLSIKLDTH